MEWITLLIGVVVGAVGALAAASKLLYDKVGKVPFIGGYIQKKIKSAIKKKIGAFWDDIVEDLFDEDEKPKRKPYSMMTKYERLKLRREEK